MKTILPLFAAVLVLAAAAQAQERTAGQAMDAQVNWAALANKIDLVSTQNKALAAALDKVMACNAEKKIYAPADSSADAQGCVSTMQGMDTTVVSGSMCESDGADTYQVIAGNRVYTKTVTCPKGWTLLGCSGGPGDMEEKAEGTFIRPNDKNGCQLVLGEPSCHISSLKGRYWLQSWVFAHCAKID